jgi:hypothetical protein
MTFNDGEDYPTVFKDAVIKIYGGETLVETLVSDTQGETETHLVTDGTYRVTIEHPNRETIDMEVVAPENNYHLFFQLANEPRRQARTTATETITLTARGEIKTPDGNETLALAAVVDNETLVEENISLDEPEVTIAATTWLLMVKKVFDDENYTQGTMDPDEGNNQITNNDRSCTARTKQYCLFSHMYADGSLQQNNQPTTMELVDRAHVFDFEDVPFGTIHLLVVFYRVAWEVTALGTTENGINEVLDGQSHTFVNNLGDRPVDHYHYRDVPPYDIIGTHYKRYQWYFDGTPVGGDQGSYNVPDQVKGTSHNISATWGGPQ